MLTFGLWSKFGRLTHYAFDAVLSKLLRNLGRRTTRENSHLPVHSFRLFGWHEALDRLDVSEAITPFPLPRKDSFKEIRWLTCVPLLSGDLARPSVKTDKVAGDNKEMNKWIDKYLGVGEWVMDQSVALAGSSSWFERTR